MGTRGVAWSPGCQEFASEHGRTTLRARVHTPTSSLSASGEQKLAASQKPRSRGILHSLFCCVCRDDGEALPAHSGAPLLVEENGAVPKVRGGLGIWAQAGAGFREGAFHDLSAGHIK